MISICELSVVLRAAFVALLLSALGDIIFYQRMFWIYIGLSAVLSRIHRYPLYHQINRSPHRPFQKAI